MFTETSANAPYAPTEGVLRIIRRFRERGLPERLTLKELEALGIALGNAPRILVALRFLGLIDDEGQRTETFNRIAKAPEADYAGTLAEIVRGAYSAVFSRTDPATDDDITVNDAFRPYEPQAQRNRMVSLFLGLCREAGIVAGGPVARKPRARTPTSAKAVNTPSPKKPTIGESNKEGGGNKTDTIPHEDSKVEQQGYQHTVELVGDTGIVTLIVSVNPIKLKGKTRTWFYELCDKLAECPTTEDDQAVSTLA